MMSSNDPTNVSVEADLHSPQFRVGVKKGLWRIVSYNFPILVVGISATEPDGKETEYVFRFELTGFPNTAPLVHIWDLSTNDLLAVEKRPKGSQKVLTSFEQWGNGNRGSVYRPWDRESGNHNNWNSTYPNFAWAPNRNLSFALEDLHEILNLNALINRARTSA
jgi:hypothetical protein